MAGVYVNPWQRVEEVRCEQRHWEFASDRAVETSNSETEGNQ